MGFTEDQRRLVQAIDGWLFPEEASILHQLASESRGSGVIVEIGSWQGKSTVCLGLGSLKGQRKPIYAIDPHTGSCEHQADRESIWTFDQFRANIEEAGITHLVKPLVKFSNDAIEDVPEPIDLIFIDGAHEYEAVLQDFQNWYPKVPVGGVMAFHDTLGWPGPRRVVRDHLYHSKQFRNVRFVKSITYAEKVECNTFMERLKNRLTWIRHEIYEAIFRAANWAPLKRIILAFRNQ